MKNFKKACQKGLFILLGIFLVFYLNFSVNSQNVLKVATDPTYPPFEFTQDSNLVGFDIELMQKIGEKLGKKIQFVPLQFDGIIGALQSNQIDVAISSMTITKEREQTVDFSRPYFKAGLAIAVSQENTTINSFADLKGKTIAVQIGTTGEQKAREIEGAQVTTFNDAPTAIQELINGKVEAVINDAPATLYAITTGNIQGIRIIDQLVTEDYYSIALPKNSPNLKDINEAIAQLITEGTYQEIYQKWFGGQAPELPLVAPALNSGKVTQTSSSFDWGNLIKNLIVKGLPLTLGLTFFSFSFGLIGGVLIGIIRLNKIHYLSQMAGIFVEFFRGTPLLVQLYVIYFGLPTLFQAFNVNLSLDKYPAAVIALSINVAAYIAEIVRGGIESIDKGQWEACHSLAMNKRQTMWYVILPQAFRRMLPPLGNQFIALIKDSSLAAVIGLEELFRQGQLIVANTYQAFLVYGVVAVVYLILSLLGAQVFNWLEILMNPKTKTEARDANLDVLETLAKDDSSETNQTDEIDSPEEIMISCDDLKKSYGQKEVLKGITNNFYKGQVTSIIGPSGCGKSTYIRCCNGLESISGGFLDVMGYDISAQSLKAKNSLPICKSVSMVFQGFNLFPHLTVLQNLMLAPAQVLSLSSVECKKRAVKYLKQVKLLDKAYEYPDNLSGGQKQRVAIARSLCMNPQLILFDEPTSALDPELAYEVLEVIEDLAKKGMTMVIVTHSMHFAKRISNRILFFKDGLIEVQGTPEEIFTNPHNESLKSFLEKVDFG